MSKENPNAPGVPSPTNPEIRKIRRSRVSSKRIIQIGITLLSVAALIGGLGAVNFLFQPLGGPDHLVVAEGEKVPVSIGTWQVVGDMDAQIRVNVGEESMGLVESETNEQVRVGGKNGEIIGKLEVEAEGLYSFDIDDSAEESIILVKGKPQSSQRAAYYLKVVTVVAGILGLQGFIALAVGLFRRRKKPEDGGSKSS